MIDEKGEIRDLPGGEESFSISFVGDVCLANSVEEGCKAEGPMFPFRNVVDVLRQTDFRVGNLEGNLYKDPDLMMHFYSDHRLLACATENAKGLAEVPFEVLTLANNHITDAGSATLQETMEFLDENGILHTGAGADDAAARIPAVYEHEVPEAASMKGSGRKRAEKRGRRGGKHAAKSLKVGFLSYVEGTGGWKGKWATPMQPGAARLREQDILEDIDRLVRRVDVVVVVLHADLEFVDYPGPWRVALSRRLADAGAALVIEHHPHVPQGIEVHNGNLIAYSLGNFVFALGDYQRSGSPSTSRSFILQVGLGEPPDGTSGPRCGALWARIVPVGLDDAGTPFLLEGDDRASFIEHIRLISQDLSDPEVVEARYAETCERYAGIYWGWTKGAFAKGGLPGFWRGMLPGFFREERLHWVEGYLKTLLGRIGKK